jgi:hypothetical protein
MTSPHDERYAILEMIAGFDKGRTHEVNNRILIESRYDWKDGANRRIRNQI